MPLLLPAAIAVVCAPDDGWRYHPKHVEQFPDKIKCVTLHLVGYILEYSYDTRTHERQTVKELTYNLNSEGHYFE